MVAPNAAPGLLERQGHGGDSKLGQPDRRGNGENHRGDQPRRGAEVKQHQGRDQIDEGRQRLHQVEQRPHQGVEPGTMGGGDAERHAEHDAGQGGEADQRNRLQRRLPVAEVGDDDERDDDEGREAPGPVQPVGERRDRKDDDEERHVHEDRREPVDQKVDQGRDRIEEAGRIVLQPGDADLDQPAERQFRFGEPALQRPRSSLDNRRKRRPSRSLVAKGDV